MGGRAASTRGDRSGRSVTVEQQTGVLCWLPRGSQGRKHDRVGHRRDAKEAGVDFATASDEALVALITAAVTGPLGWLAKGAVQRARDRRPLQTFVEQDTAIIFGTIPDWVGFPYYFDCQPEQLPVDPPHMGVDWWTWAIDNHGIPARRSEIAVTLLPKTESTVIVDRLRVKLVEVTPTPPGSIVVHPHGGAAIVHRQGRIRLLGKMAPIVSFLEQGSAEKRSGFTFALSAGEPARLAITAHAEEADYLYKWTAVLDLIVGGKRRSVEISNNGKPFVLHGGGGCEGFEWSDGSWQLFRSL